MSDALALWRGPPLADVYYEEFAQTEIRRLEELRLLALEARAAAELELGHHAAVIAELEGVLVEQPSREAIAASSCSPCTDRDGRQKRWRYISARANSWLSSSGWSPDLRCARSRRTC